MTHKNWIFFSAIWYRRTRIFSDVTHRNLTLFFNMTQRIVTLFTKGLKDLDPSKDYLIPTRKPFWIMTLRIELFFNMTQEIELTFCHSKELNFFFFFMTQRIEPIFFGNSIEHFSDPQNWTFFLNTTHRIELFFFLECDLNNWTGFSKIWLQELNIVLHWVTQRIEPSSQNDSKNWTLFEDYHDSKMF